MILDEGYFLGIVRMCICACAYGTWSCPQMKNVDANQGGWEGKVWPYTLWGAVIFFFFFSKSALCLSTGVWALVFVCGI